MTQHSNPCPKCGKTAIHTICPTTLLDELTELMSKGPNEPFELGKMLALMQKHGSSVTLNYGEDTGSWEICWITGGKRICGTPMTNPTRAALCMLTNVWRRIIDDLHWHDLATSNTDSPYED